MTVPTTASSTTLLGNGSTTVFSFSFIAAFPSNIIVVLTNALGTTSTLAVGTQYSLAINAPAAGQIWGVGGTITYPLVGAPMPAGSHLTVSRVLPITQLISINNQGDFYPQVVEKALDLLCMSIQGVQNGVALLNGEVTPLLSQVAALAATLAALAASNTTNSSVVATGSTAPRFLSDRFAVMLNVKDFGAKGNGIADDTVAIQAAFNALSAGGMVFIPAGKYLISATLVVPAAAPLMIVGSGPLATTIVQTSATAGGIAFLNAPNAFFSGGGIRDLTISAGQNAAVVGSIGIGLLVQSANDVFTVNNIDVVSFYTGIELDGCWNTRWMAFRILTWGAKGLAINADATYPVTGGNAFSGMLASNIGNGAPVTSDAVSITATGGEYFTSCEANGGTVGWHIHPRLGVNANSCFFTACLADTNSQVGWFFDGSAGTYSSHVCVNCWASYTGTLTASAGTGVLIQSTNASNSLNVRWVGGRIRENGAAGVAISGTAQVTIMDSDITANSTSSAGTFPGISVSAGTSIFQFMNNMLGNFASTLTTQGPSIVIQPGASTGFIISGNLTVNPVGSGPSIVNGSTVPSGQYIIANNLG